MLAARLPAGRVDYPSAMIAVAGPYSALRGPTGRCTVQSVPRTRNRQVIRAIVCLLLTFLTAPDVRAQALRRLAPTAVADYPPSLSLSGSTGLFRIESAPTLPAGAVLLAISRDNHELPSKHIDYSRLGVASAWGLGHGLELWAQLDVQERIDVDGADNQGVVREVPRLGSTQDGWFAGAGRLQVGSKLRLFSTGRGTVAAAARASFAVGALEKDTIGNGHVLLHLQALTTQALAERIALHAVVGFARQRAVEGVPVGQLFTWGIGITARAAPKVLLSAEVAGSTPVGDHLLTFSTLDFTAGPVVYLTPLHTLKAGLRVAAVSHASPPVAVGERLGLVLSLQLFGRPD